ncbi:MAG: TVP38/TMEM64 family protein [Pelosinus sp.]|nr:TVP38/TMEM64 family protein [Pelosinus sp.]
MKTKPYQLNIIKIGVLLLLAICYYLSPGLKKFVHTGLILLEQHNFAGLRAFILTYEIWAPVVSILLMILQSLIPVMPGLALTIINAWIFGWQWGMIYTWIGALCGAILDFGLAQWYGRPLLEHFCYGRYYKNIDCFLERNGVFAVFVTRLIPFIPFKIISYGAGLTSMPIIRFAIATAVGQTPAIVLYSLLGHNILHSWPRTLLITSFLLGIGILAYYYKDKILKYLK